MDFSATLILEHDRACLVVVGELDLLTTAALRRECNRLLGAGARRVCIDVGGLTFCDAIGLSEFARLHNAVTEAGGTVTFLDARPSFRRLCEAGGLMESFGLGPAGMASGGGPTTLLRGLNAGRQAKVTVSPSPTTVSTA